MSYCRYKRGAQTMARHTPSGADIAMGTPRVESGRVAIQAEAGKDGLVGNEAVPSGTAVYDGDKATGETWTKYETLYWDDTAKKVTTTVGANSKIGIAAEARASGDTTGEFVHSD
jgi:predicted RecA/RadA family phage recombinase